MKLLASFTIALAACAARIPSVGAPRAVAPVPSARQLAWHELEFCAFVHFNMDTFTDREWGEGTESPDLFAPTELDCRQWARVAKDAGMRGIILTAKHHDGFCLWPSKLTDHSVAHSKWRDGHGDVLRELSDACRELGLKFGVYLSPWDRHSPLYGSGEKYNDYFASQLEEVLTDYGDVFEVWFDGACGEGPNGKRQVYDWPRFVDVVRRCQPNAVIFSDVGPDVRWVGNEHGIAGETCWSMISPEGHAPGADAPPIEELNHGREDGTHWIAPECDVSIRPGWYYHASDDERVKSLDRLLEIYYASVGRNGSLLLNMPADRRGLIPERDAARVLELRRALDAVFRDDLARGQAAVATNVRANDARFAANSAVDGDPRTYWATDDDVLSASLTLNFGRPRFVDHVVVGEAIELGQRVEQFAVLGRVGEDWRELAHGTTIGHKRVLRFGLTAVDAVRLDVRAARACPAIASFELYSAPADELGPLHGAWVGGNLEPGVLALYREGEFQSVRDIPGFIGEAAVHAKAVDLSLRRRDENFAMQFEGFVLAPVDGIYAFATNSDDGSVLWVDGECVVDNDGLHGARRIAGRIALSRGMHLFNVDYFNATGAAKLEVSWSGPNFAEQAIPEASLFRGD